MSEILSMIPNREFKLSELSLLTSSASEIDRVVQNAFTYVFLTQEEYDAITPISTTTYFIVES